MKRRRTAPQVWEIKGPRLRCPRQKLITVESPETGQTHAERSIRLRLQTPGSSASAPPSPSASAPGVAGASTSSSDSPACRCAGLSPSCGPGNVMAWPSWRCWVISDVAAQHPQPSGQRGFRVPHTAPQEPRPGSSSAAASSSSLNAISPSWSGLFARAKA